jgi:3-oxoacyl-[acyl-carrier-protein] synthase II
MIQQGNAMPAGAGAERTVITGIGVVSPVGIGTETFWSNLIAGKSGIGSLRALWAENLPTKLAAEVSDFDPERHIFDKKFLKVMSRGAQLGVAAASLAMRDSGLSLGQFDPNRLGVVFGSGRIYPTPEELAEAVMHCSDEASFQFGRWDEETMGEIAPLWMLRQLPNLASCLVSIEHNARGPNNTITSRESSALLALGEAVRVIERGAADCMIVGACSSNVHPVDITKLSLYEGLSRRDDDPSRACRPFDFERDGTIVGEGSAVFVVERFRHAVARGAKIHGEILGVGAGCDGRGYANGAGGTGLVQAIRSALTMAQIDPSELSHVNAHGKSTQRDDLVEARAYHRAFGSAAENIPVTALKSYFGHCGAGSGAVELAGSILALRHGEIPATLNYETPDPRCSLNVVHREPTRLRTSTAISVNRTLMGQSAAAIVRAI